MRFYNDNDYFEYCLLINEIRDEEAKKKVIRLTKQEMIDLKLWNYFVNLRHLINDDYWSSDLFELTYSELIELNLID